MRYKWICKIKVTSDSSGPKVSLFLAQHTGQFRSSSAKLSKQLERQRDEYERHVRSGRTSVSRFLVENLLLVE